MIRRVAFLLPLAVAALLHLAAAAVPSVVEGAYSRGVYPWVARGLAGLTSPFPFALADAIPLVVLGLVGLGAVRLRRIWQADRRRALLAAGRTLMLAAGLVYLVFLLAWGVNYRRQPLAASLGLEVRPAPAEELASLARELVADANDLRAGRTERDGAFALTGGRASVFAADAGPRPKASLLSPVLARLGISGIFVPFTGEPLVNALLPESELPFSAAHERAHAAGWAREDEANFLAWRACSDSANPDFRYSGALVASLYVVRTLLGTAPETARAVAEQRSAGVRRDIEAIRAYVRRYEGRMARAGERVNDAYLRSQGEARGVQSYGRMVDLLLAERRVRVRERDRP